ncbi:radical SAM protein [uncultured Mucilaginibacter sp.]|uniref:B12-binding domain-containing radical SAM protein n=1 Tax=uncultured Mucilaginibacter sp. TaxID=797541 RepID=UPI0025CCDDA5|nr:radical SAM protein [uncultured Mucilaginibacter sp.]
MVDILLINSPIHDYSKYPRFKTSYSTPVGLLYLGTMAKKAGFEVKIIDAEQNQLAHYDILALIDDLRPSFVGFNVFTINNDIVEGIIDLVPKDVTVILGGPHITAMGFQYFQKHFLRADILVRHDGEFKLVDILRKKPYAEISDIYYKENDVLKMSSGYDISFDLDDLPIVDRTLLRGEPYIKNNKLYVDMSISRGCIYTCSFCAGSCKHAGTVYKRRSLLNIAKEVNELIEVYHVEGIEIVDDLPFYRIRDLEEFLDYIEKADLKIEWEINFPFLFLRTLNKTHFNKMKAMGIKRIAIGIESGTYDVRALSGKRIYEEPLVTLLKTIFDSKIYIKGYFIIGFPHETRDQIDQTLTFAKKIFDLSHQSNKAYFDPRIFIYKPFPKTPMWTQLLLDGYKEDELLKYHDFELDISYFNKHAWRSNLQLSEVEPHVLTELINEFYLKIRK